MIAFKKLPFKIDQTWITSDSHYNHKNICKGTTSWDSPHNEGCRNFETLELMNESIVNNINDSVKPDDLLIHLGDWSFGGVKSIFEFRDSIRCKNVILIQGNHDHLIYANTHGELFQEFTQIGFYQIESLRFVCSHYPMSIWHQSHHDVPLFYGHVHGSFQNVGKSLDVGIDNIFKLKKSYSPISLQESYNIASKRETYLESHHSEHTN